MNAIGNDNYRQGMEPPEPIKRGGGWLSSNMAQLMVFLNGLILTITAFATLSVFIDEIVKDGLVKVTDDVQQYITEGYNQTEQNLYALATIVSVSEDTKEEAVKAYIKHSISGLEHINEIYLVKKNAVGSQTLNLLGDGKYAASFQDQAAFDTFIKKTMQGAKRDVYITTTAPDLQASGQSEDNRVYDRDFILVKPIRQNSDTNEYIVSVASLGEVINLEWLEKRPTIRDIQITDVDGDVSIYSYQKEPGKDVRDSRYTNIFTNEFAGRNFDVKLELIITPRESFLQKIPLLMLLFGVTLTLIGTLYVRNNQSQSQRLSTMNKELAHKNFELNQQVSERERLNKVIQTSARENGAIINSVTDIIFELGVDGKILFINKAWNSVTGFEQERSIGRNLFELIHAQDQEEQKSHFEQLVRGQKKSYRAFTRLRSADGSFRAVELAISMMRQDENKNMRVVGTITDVEERRRAERALSEAEKKYRTIVENAASGIYQVTPEGQFLSANPAFAKIIGYSSPEEVLREINNSHQELYLNSTGREKFLKEISVLDHAQNIELQIKRHNGDVVWVSENVRPVNDDEGMLLFYEGSMEDVDQRKKAEIALKDAKLESDIANRSKSEFLANMSHELRTPLNSIIGFSEIIKDESFGGLGNSQYKDYADNIFNSGNKLLRVINEILDVSRIEAGERALNETIVNVKSTVASCLELMDGKMKSAKLRVENKILDTDLGFVAESQSVKQMMLNLISNAIKFSPENGFLMIDAEIDSKGRLRISFTDTGTGMNEDELEKALSPFGQVNTEHNRSNSGTGLGLTLVKSLVELHGGALEMVSQKGIGTTATLIFPQKRVAQIGKKTTELKQGDAMAEPKEI